MIPIGDDNSARVITPYINYLLIALNILVFVFLQKFGADHHFTYAYAAVPAEITSGRDIVTEPQLWSDPLTGQSVTLPGLQRTPIPVWLTIITSMFMHGGLAHLGGNMLYLLIFGDNLESRMGHGRYLAFYLLAGVVAALSQVFATVGVGLDPLVPMVGASGAISGVLGGYLLLFPRNRVRVLFFPFIMHFPAVLVLGFWIVFQIVSGLGMLGGEDTGIAYAAHIGGFIAGLVFVKVFDRGLPQSRSGFPWRRD